LAVDIKNFRSDGTSIPVQLIYDRINASATMTIDPGRLKQIFLAAVEVADPAARPDRNGHC
jgi:hypothetical protein